MTETRGPGWAPVFLSYAAFVLVGLGAGIGGILIPAQMADYGVDEATIGITFPTAMAVVPDLVEPRLVATAIGLMNGVSVLGGAGLPWLAGRLAQHVGIWTLMPFALALSLLQLGVWRLMVARTAPAPVPQE
ncbi:hypothetical protein [Dactylosporangium sp. NPDC048998]|uniref:hypothetical protein n=1 Tax=Dactylosporangium sp. NPDC048998 TaxID=3363976 RepID=UPI00372309DE